MHTSSIARVLSAGLILFAARGHTQSVPANPRRPAAAAVVVRIEPEKSTDFFVVEGPEHVVLSSGLPLTAGEVIRCAANAAGTLILLTADNLRFPVTSEQCKKGYTVQAGTGSGKYTAAIRNYGKIAGRPRGGLSGLLLWPKNDIKMRSTTAAAIEWRPQTSGMASLSLHAGQPDRIVWSQDVDATKGRVASDDLAAALRLLAVSGDTAITLQIRLTATQADSATFTVASAAAEQRLTAKLREVADVPGLAGSLLRADAFLEEDLPREALDEYAAALANTPDALFLLQKAAGIAIEIGDPRATDLARRARALRSR
jgi:hypothetical protein